jgi:hypothetical protein
MRIIDWTRDRHRGRRRLLVAMVMEDGRSPPATDVDIDVLVFVVVATHDCGGEGYSFAYPESLQKQ